MKPVENKFYCNACGLCCKSLKNSDLYKDLDRGDGVCKFFNEYNNLCSIYEERPLVCRVDEMYKLYFYKQLSKEKYYQLNYKACSDLKRKYKKDGNNG